MSTRSVIDLDESMHSVDAIQRAAYRLSDRFGLQIERRAGQFRCTLVPVGAEAVSEDDVARFLVHVNDYTLRERIRRDTDAVRNVILSLAFSSLQAAEDVE